MTRSRAEVQSTFPVVALLLTVLLLIPLLGCAAPLSGDSPQPSLLPKEEPASGQHGSESSSPVPDRDSDEATQWEPGADLRVYLIGETLGKIPTLLTYTDLGL